MEKLEPLYMVGEKVRWCSNYGKLYEGKKLKLNHFILQRSYIWVFMQNNSNIPGRTMSSKKSLTA